MATRLAALEHMRTIYKCPEKAHITIEQDLEYHRYLHSGTEENPAKPKPELDHDGHSVATIQYTPGSAPLEAMKCVKCGRELVAVSPEPRRASLRERDGLVNHLELYDARAKIGLVPPRKKES